MKRLSLKTIITASLTALFLPQAELSAQDPKGFRLYARPSICVSYDSSEPCNMSLLVSWESDMPADVCLRQAEQQSWLDCWQNSLNGEIRLQYANTQDVLYQLLEESSEELLAETEIVVINRDLRDSRKRRRHVWSIL